MDEIEIKRESDKLHKPRQKRMYIFLFWFFIAVMSCFTIFYMFLKSESIKEFAVSFYNFKSYPDSLYNSDSAKLTSIESNLSRRVSSLQKRIENLSPYGIYLIVNTTNNTFVLRNRKTVIREGICSTGSYILLDAGEGRQWMFKTPKGQFRILGKIVDPIWIKPDWAFVEESLPIPPRGHPDRLEYGTLGDYALTLGQGYLIHGTLYQRFLGLPVTHGCIRLGDEDLKVVYKSLEIGSRVYIF
jgi:hypothetical protein